jgi:NitT/TauT family transport system substrate-binding protein
MGKFRIQPHGRLHEWIAEEKGYFAAEGLDYEFVRGPARTSVGTPAAGETQRASVVSTEDAPAEIKTGAFESMEAGRACEVSSACHWAVNMAASAEHGKMYGKAYSIGLAGIYVPSESSIRCVEDLAGVEVGVGYHSGSHFSALQALYNALPKDQVKLRFIGGPAERVELLLDRKVPAANVFTIQRDIIEQQGFRKVLDTTFIMGFLITGDAEDEDVDKYFRALQRAQQDIDLEPEQYKHYFLNEINPKYHGMIDVRNFSPGERIILGQYTQEMYEKTHRWMEDLGLFPEEQVGHQAYQSAVLV